MWYCMHVYVWSTINAHSNIVLNYLVCCYCNSGTPVFPGKIPTYTCMLYISFYCVLQCTCCIKADTCRTKPVRINICDLHLLRVFHNLLLGAPPPPVPFLSKAAEKVSCITKSQKNISVFTGIEYAPHTEFI